MQSLLYFIYIHNSALHPLGVAKIEYHLRLGVTAGFSFLLGGR